MTPVRLTKVSAANSTIAPLREVEHAGCLVDEHEADRDEAIHDAGEQAADQHLEEELMSKSPCWGPRPSRPYP